jgi:hypothetical protein
MRNTSGRFAGVARAAIVVAITLGLATPAAAQFGGLKKKLKQAAGQEGANQAAAQATGATPEAAQASSPRAGGAGGQVVLTDDVVKQLLAGLKAGKDARAAAAKEDTPYGRYKQSEIAYADAQPKCEAAKQAWSAKAANDEKLMNNYGAMTQKMVNAQQKGDQKLAAVYFDSAMTMMSPSCAVKQPVQPDQYYELQREVDNRAEQSEMKASGLSRSELFMAKERAEAILRGAPGPDISASEKNAVSSRADELKRLMSIEQVTPARAGKSAPATAPAPAPAPAAATAPTAGETVGNCVAQNTQRHQPELEALVKRAQEAQKANDTATLRAIADSINGIQMAGCTGDR